MGFFSSFLKLILLFIFVLFILNGAEILVFLEQEHPSMASLLAPLKPIFSHQSIVPSVSPPFSRNSTIKSKSSNKAKVTRRTSSTPILPTNRISGETFLAPKLVEAIEMKHPVNSWVDRGLQLTAAIQLNYKQIPSQYRHQKSQHLYLRLSIISLNNYTSATSVPESVWIQLEESATRFRHVFYHQVPGKYVLRSEVVYQKQMILSSLDSMPYVLLGDERIKDLDLFFKWMKLNGATMNFYLKTFTENGFSYRGVALSKNMTKNELVVSVPERISVCVNNIVKTTLDWMIQDARSLDEDLLFPIFFTYCKLRKEECSWYPFILSLPDLQTQPILPHLYTTKQVNLFKGTVIYEDVTYRREKALGRVTKMVKMLKKLPEFEQYFYTSAQQTAMQKLLKWGITMITSRTWGVTKNKKTYGGESLSVPLLDLVNHKYEANYLDDSIIDHLSFFTYKPTQKGEEFFITYGEEKMVNYKLLVYGWLDLSDKIFINVDLDNLAYIDDGFYENRTKILYEMIPELEEDEDILLIMNRTDTAARVLLSARIYLLSAEELKNAKTSEAVVNKFNNSPGQIYSVENEKKAIALLEDFNKKFFQNNPNLDEDALTAVMNSNTSSMLEIAAALFRRDEHRILKWFQQYLDVHKKNLNL